MAVSRSGSGRHMALVWAVILVGPVSWSVSFGLVFWLTRAVCDSGSRIPMGVVGATGTVLVTAGLAFAALIVRDEAVAQLKNLRLVADIAAWGNAIFLTVIAVASAPILLMSQCTP
jgi:hypothetical protein